MSQQHAEAIYGKIFNPAEKGEFINVTEQVCFATPMSSHNSAWESPSFNMKCLDDKVTYEKNKWAMSLSQSLLP